MNGISKAQHADLDTICQILAQAFLKEEFWHWAMQAQHLKQDKQKQKLVRLFKIQCQKYSLPFQSAYLLEN